MARYTKKHAESAFNYLVQCMNKRVATSYNDIGAYRLDYSQYGGYVIEEITSEGGGVCHPFGSQRRKAEEFYDTCHYAVCVLDEYVKAQQRHQTERPATTV